MVEPLYPLMGRVHAIVAVAVSDSYSFFIAHEHLVHITKEHLLFSHLLNGFSLPLCHTFLHFCCSPDGFKHLRNFESGDNWDRPNYYSIRVPILMCL